MPSVTPIKSESNQRVVQNKRNRNLAAALGTTGLLLSSGGYYIGHSIEGKKKTAERARVDKINKKAEQEYNSKKFELLTKINSLETEVSQDIQKKILKKTELVNKYNNLAAQEMSPEVKKVYDQLCGKFPDLVVRWNNYKLTKMPKCIMVYGHDEEKANLIMDWFCKTAECVVNKADAQFDIMEPLDKHRINCSTQGHGGERMLESDRWQLLLIKDFDVLINPQKVQFEMIETAKDLMSDLDSYNTTILFCTKDPELLDEVAIESHRVSPQIDVDGNILQGYSEPFDKNEFFKVLKRDIEKKDIKTQIDELNKEHPNEKLIKELKKELDSLKLIKIEPNAIKKYGKRGLAIGAAISAAITAVSIISTKRMKK